MKFLYSTQHSSDSAGSMLTSTCVWMTMHILTGDIGIPLNQEPRVEDSYLAMTAQNSKLGSTRSIYHITCRSCHLLPALSYLLLWLCSYWCISQVCKSWCVSFSKGCSHLSGLKCTSTGRGGVLHYWGKIQALNSSDHKRTWAGVRSLYLTLFQVNSHLTVSCIKNTLPVPTTDHLSSTTLWVSDQVKRQKYLLVIDLRNFHVFILLWSFVHLHRRSNTSAILKTPKVETHVLWQSRWVLLLTKSGVWKELVSASPSENRN